MITVEFRDFNDMVLFAENLLGRMEPAKTDVTSIAPTATLVQLPASQPETADQMQEAVVLNVETGSDPEDSSDGTSYSLEEVRAKLAALQKAGKRAEVKALLTSFGVAKLSELGADRYGELMEKAGEI